MSREGVTLPAGFQVARSTYLVFEVLEVVSFVMAEQPAYLCAGEQLWIPHEQIPDRVLAKPLPILDTFILHTLRAVITVNDRSVPSLWGVARYVPAWDADVLTFVGAGAPGHARRGFRCACDRLGPVLCRWPWGGYVCQACWETTHSRDGALPAGPLTFEDSSRRLVVAAHPTRCAPDLVTAGQSAQDIGAPLG